MLSIGIFTYSSKPRGSVVHAAHLAEALQRRGADVTLYALSNRGTSSIARYRARCGSSQPSLQQATSKR